MEVTDRLGRNLKAEFGARVLYFATSGLTILLLGRMLEPDVFGLFFLSVHIVSGVQLLADLEVPYSAARYVTDYEGSDPGKRGPIVAFALRVVALTSTVVAVSLLVLNRPLAELFRTPGLASLLLLGAGFVLARAYYRYFRRILQGFERIKLSAILYAAEGFGRLASVAVLLYLGFGAAGAMGGYILGSVFASLVGAVLFYRNVYPELDFERSLGDSDRNRVLRYSVPLLMIRGAKTVDNVLDTVLVGYFFTPAIVGYYVLSKQAVHLLQAPASALGFSVAPIFGNHEGEDERDQISSIYRTATVQILLLYVPATAGMVLLARPALTIFFGPTYASATTILQIFAPLATLMAIEEISGDALDYLGRARTRSVAKGVTAVANILAIVVLAPTVGIAGVVTAKVVTHALYAGTLLYVMHSEVALESLGLFREFGLILVITSVMSGVIFQSAQFISGLMTLVGVIVFGVVVWAVLAITTGVLEVEKIESVLR